MKFTFVVLALVAALALITGATSNSPQGGDCVTVREASVHGYYEPDFEAGLVGWFIEGEELKVVNTDGGWRLVAGRGKDAGLRSTRMTGWVHSSYMGICE